MKKVLLIVLSLLSFSLFAENRNALLIANEQYLYESPLTTPVNEARDLRNALEKVGFNVILIENASLDSMVENLISFKKQTQAEGGIGFFHYGGHAVQVDGENYLLPVDKEIQDLIHIRSRAIQLDDVMISMQADSNIVILDACRNNPLKGIVRGSTRGLSVNQKKPKNSIVVYAAEAGSTAQDGMFTPILTQHLTDKNSFTEIIRDVRKEVKNLTRGTQIPGCYDQLDNNIFLCGVEVTKSTPTTVIELKTTPMVSSITQRVVTEDIANAEKFNQTGIKYYQNFDFVNAAANFEKAAELGLTEAQVNLALCYVNGEGVEQNDHKAFLWYEKAAIKGDSDAQNSLAICYENGRGIDQNLEKAVEWYEKSAKKGNPMAQNNLGLCYQTGNGVALDYVKAVELYKKAALQDNTDAMNNLGVCYELGYGVAENGKRAFNWYEKAAEMGNAAAQNNMGLCYQNNIGVDYNEERAFEWFKRSAEQNYVGGIKNLALCYYFGTSVDIDYYRAAELFEEAAEMGDYISQYYLGLCYFYEKGVPQSYTKAVEWCSKSADQGFSSALCLLGEYYYEGKWVRKDRRKAKELWMRAAAQGDETAIEDLEEFFDIIY